MTTSCSILISTYGDQKWKDLAESRALPSTVKQGALEVLIKHDPHGTIASVRNELAANAKGSLLIHLDADDELTDGYVDAVRASANRTSGHTLFAPMVQYVNGRRAQAPKYWPEVPLDVGNWLVIGTAVPRDLFLQVGGFPEAVHGFEDWAGFAKCWKAGAQIMKVPQAVYRAHVTPNSRNRRMSVAERLYWHQRIGFDVFPEKYEAPTVAEDEARALAGRNLRFH